jgi:quercetin dioxygenase-like cupin family protein
MAKCERRSFLLAAMAASPWGVRALAAQGPAPAIAPVRAGADRLGESHVVGAGTVGFKVLTAESKGDVFIMENTHTRKGGPPRHLHHGEDEWFFVVAGDYVFEVGSERFTLAAGDSILAPRAIPHAYAFVGPSTGRLLIAYTPANQMEAFFRGRTEGAQYSTDAARYKAFGMELLGPPLAIG